MIGRQGVRIKQGRQKHRNTHTHTHTHTNKQTNKQKQNGLPTQDELHRRILAVPGRCIGDQHRDVSKAKLFWGCSRHHGCETEVVPAAPSLLLLAPGQSSLLSAGKVCRPTSLAKLRSTLDTGHGRRQQLNFSLKWRKRPSSGRSHSQIAAWVYHR